MRRVILESPYAGDRARDVERNVQYARQCMLDCIRRNEAPFASHLIYTQVLDDKVPEQRDTGIKMGYAWGMCAEVAVFYADHGFSNGMQKAKEFWQRLGIPCEVRYLNQP